MNMTGPVIRKTTTRKRRLCSKEERGENRRFFLRLRSNLERHSEQARRVRKNSRLRGRSVADKGKRLLQSFAVKQVNSALFWDGRMSAKLVAVPK